MRIRPRKASDEPKRGTVEFEPAVRGASPAGRRPGSAPVGVDCPAGHRRAAGRSGHAGSPVPAPRVQTQPLRRNLGDRERALRVAGGGRGRGDPAPDAVGCQPGAAAVGAGPVPSRPVDGPRDERGGGRQGDRPQQGMGEHAARSAGRDESGGASGPLPRGLPRLLLHVHAAAVHAHERHSGGRGRAVREGGWRPATQRAGHPAAGGGLLPRAARASRGDRRRQGGLVPRPDPTPAGGPRRCQPARAGAVERLRESAELPWAGNGPMPGRASWEPGLLRPGGPPDRWSTPHVPTLL